MTEATTAAAAATSNGRKIFCNANIEVIAIKNEGVSRSATGRPFRSVRANVTGLKRGGERTVVAFGDNVDLIAEGTNTELNVVIEGSVFTVLGPKREFKKAA